MMHTGRSPVTRPALWAVVLAFCATMVPGSAMASRPGVVHTLPTASSTTGVSDLAAAHGRTRIRGFSDQRTAVTLGRKVIDRVVVLPKARRTVLVQARRPGSSHFVTQSRGHSAADGSFRAVYAPASAGTWRFRLQVLPSAHQGAAGSATRILTANDLAAPRVVTELQVSGLSLDGATLTWVNPTDRDFTGVTIRRAAGVSAPVSQVDGTAVTDTDRSATTFTATGLTADTEYSYALFAHDSSGNFSRGATVTLRTGRFGVSFLAAGSVTRTSATLTWANPTDDAFAGVIVRRAVGTTPPASATDGTAAGDDVLSPDDSFTDPGLAAGTTYSYAVFARDAAQHVAAAATTTVTTRGNGVSSMLAVNPLPSAHTDDRVTVGTPVAFDGSESLAALGADLVAWDISYGDHTSDSLNGSLGSADVFNTTHTFTGGGPHTVTLTVRDSDGNTASMTSTVAVFDAPKVSISTSTGSPEPGAVPLQIKAETPVGTTITSYRMEVTGDDTFFMDGDSAPPASQDVTFASGTYTVILTVTNDAGGTAVSAPLTLEVP